MHMVFNFDVVLFRRFFKTLSIGTFQVVWILFSRAFFSLLLFSLEFRTELAQMNAVNWLIQLYGLYFLLLLLCRQYR